MLLFAPNHSAALARRIAEALGTSLSSSEEREFDGGEHKMRPLQDVRGHDVFVVQSCRNRYSGLPRLSATFWMR